KFYVCSYFALMFVLSCDTMSQRFPERHLPMQSQTEFSRLRELSGLSIGVLSERLGFSPRTLYRWSRGEAEPREAAMHVLRTLAARPDNENHRPAFTFIDLFAGIGGLRKGFEPIGGHCVFTSEWNEYAQQTYKANFRCDHEVAGDITKIHAEDIPAHDMLLAGFPCQPFS